MKRKLVIYKKGSDTIAHVERISGSYQRPPKEKESDPNKLTPVVRPKKKVGARLIACQTPFLDQKEKYMPGVVKRACTYKKRTRKSKKKGKRR